jgi:GNAT superfamily N-acetyltransferase
MPQTHIRRAGPQDAPAVVAISRSTFVETFGDLYSAQDLSAFLDESYDLDRTRADLADPAKAFWLVEDQGQVVGHALAGPCGLPHAEVTPACGELKRFYLLKAFQNGGTGKRLFGEIMDWLVKDGPRDLWIGVWSENHGALRFYHRQGFEQVGTYGFQVGETVDHEFILRRPAHSFSNEAMSTADNVAGAS